MHQAQPKEGHKIWLTQETDAKSWSSLKHVQPKRGAKGISAASVEKLSSAIVGLIPQSEKEPAVPKSQERRKRAKDTPGYYSLFLFFFSFVISKCDRQSIRAMDEAGVSHGVR